MAIKQGHAQRRAQNPRAVRHVGICLILTVVLSVFGIPPLPVFAAPLIAIDQPSGPLGPGVSRISGTFSGVYDVELAVGGDSLVSAHMDDPEADGSGSWYADVDFSKYDGPVELAARGKDSVTRYVAWSPYMSVAVDNPGAALLQVQITSPGETSPVMGSVNVLIQAVGKNPVSKVQIRINGGDWKDAPPKGSGYQYKWKTAAYAGRVNSLEAKAVDSNGNTGYSSAKYVKVANVYSQAMLQEDQQEQEGWTEQDAQNDQDVQADQNIQQNAEAELNVQNDQNTQIDQDVQALQNNETAQDAPTAQDVTKAQDEMTAPPSEDTVNEVNPDEGMQMKADSGSTEAEAASSPTTVTQQVYSQDRAMWIWENESYPLIMNPGSRNVLDAMASDTSTFGQRPIRTLYLAVGPYFGMRMLEDKRPEVRDFVGWAHDKGYQVQALISGGTTPPYFGAYARYRTQAVAEFEGILNYNLSSDPRERFDGVNIDTEPYSLGDFKSAKPSVQLQYLDMLKALMDRKQASGLDLQVGAAIPRWFDTSVDASSISWNGSVKWMSQHVQDTLDYISIMDYRDQADGSAGIIEQARGEIDYANQIGKPNSVVIGVETIDVADGGDPEAISFYEEGRTYMESELNKVYAAFEGDPAFGGIALHHYGNLRIFPSAWGPGGVFWQPPQDSEAPSAVTGTPQAAAFDYQRVDITYGPASDNATVKEYRIYRGTDAQFEPDPAHLAGISNKLNFRDVGLLPDTTYVYMVTAVDSSGNEGPASQPFTATTGHTDLKPMIVGQMQVTYDGTKATVSLQVVDKETGAGLQATVYGRFTSMGGKYVGGATTATGTYTASSEAINAAAGKAGFAARRILAPGYYWAQAYDSPDGRFTEWGG
ncbi:Ig-like domain-containing protein [Paenibacillus sp. Y412MC10]|uniref:Ig-like domain-containing protein n=1 Tax=Geobacillus sp. (strain Y412MC10) TaxID=481743 RepID=UPI0011A99C78|nr:Ig-like domain-containing protein [Paenibacillus sp. Y412MC10]